MKHAGAGHFVCGLVQDTPGMPMAAMKLYMTPGSCSTGIHIILDEPEEAYDTSALGRRHGHQSTDLATS